MPISPLSVFPRLRWQRGNDALLRVIVSEVLPPVETGAAPVVQPFDLSQVDGLTVSVFVGTQGRVVPVTVSLAEGEQNVVALQLPATLPAATYGIELRCRKNGHAVRTAFASAFAVVEAQHEAAVTLSRIDGPLPDVVAEDDANGAEAEQQEPVTVEAELTLSVEYVTQAVVRGKNVYELWLEAGNEGTLEDYLAGFYRPEPATATTDGLLTAEDKQALDRLKEAEVLMPEDAGELARRILYPEE